MDSKKPNQLIKSLDRALNILEVIVESENGMGVTEISRELDVHKSTVYRLLDTLKYRGYLEKNKDNHKYLAGIKLFELSSKVINEIDSRMRVRPYLEELMEKTKETVHLGILDDGEIIYLDKVESTATIRMYSQVGKRAPVHSTSLGKTILAQLSESEVCKILEEKGMVAKTKNTITDVDKFLEHLKEVKKQGYAVDNEEQEKDIRCIAGPIFNHRGEVVAAFSISAPISRMNQKRMGKLAELVVQYSEKMSRSLGYSG
ncbi:IclR family transcriptional regulator [Halanaerobium congolense]|jgi:DNA-binding IclR family transcriptional regulator|uniref:Glycerol operon regulatory protein n=1 Tax=Halanaerobium congolense TaxID=54121 RepID=A0A1G6M4T7_9FIRM|nr:IclR family transcriptional regulator [Halanaerobium congolense]KXS48448.1 MAG: IclR family transcriptional regulator [Halanaerobium sp. T82-1]OEG62129.1 MAG: IclR family transcriptional regulator [Halanaerobium sp. MDAL1]PUU90090.1 MAG: IclR family transcriptional regulator [Halanaerobium sp.]PTX16617.1 IclR family transcriptional regulator [Halanaerobium congolense]PXV65350.1 IclR family transcriptional regulator [Halanaerobium congolense]